MLLIEKLMVSYYFLFGIAVITVIIGIPLTRKYMHKTKLWRIIDFFGILVSCIGISPIVHDAQVIFYEREIKRYQKMIESKYRHAIIYNLNESPYYRKFTHTEFSPNNLKDIQDSHNTIYEWIKSHKEYIIRCHHNQTNIELDSIQYPSLRFKIQTFIELQKNINDYNRDVDTLNKYKNRIEPMGVTFYYIVFAPIFLAIGLGWAFVKFFAKRR